MPIPEAPPEEVTLGEIGRNLAQLSNKVEKLSEKVEQYPKWGDLKHTEETFDTKLSAAVIQRTTEISELNRRVIELESWQTWFVRIALGLVITAVVSAFFVFKP